MEKLPYRQTRIPEGQVQALDHPTWVLKFHIKPDDFSKVPKSFLKFSTRGFQNRIFSTRI